MKPTLTTDVLAASGIAPAVRVGMIRKGAGARFRGKPQFMSSRTTPTVVRFKSAFSLPGFDAPQPPGEYRVDHDEESLEGASRIAWRRVATFLHLPAISASGATQQMVPIEPASLEAALEQDQRQ